MIRAPRTAPPLANGGLPVVGNAVSMTGNVSEWLAGQYRKLGPVCCIRAFARVFTVLAGPEAKQFEYDYGINGQTAGLVCAGIAGLAIASAREGNSKVDDCRAARIVAQARANAIIPLRREAW